MKKYFNIAGPCNEMSHYMVPVLNRNKEVYPLVDQGQYFVIHAARQTGKTTLIKALVNYYNSEGSYYALYCSLETVQAYTDPNDGIPEIFKNIRSEISYSKLPEKEKFGVGVNFEDPSILIKNNEYPMLYLKFIFITDTSN